MLPKGDVEEALLSSIMMKNQERTITVGVCGVYFSKVNPNHKPHIQKGSFLCYWPALIHALVLGEHQLSKLQFPDERPPRPFVSATVTAIKVCLIGPLRLYATM